MEIKELVSYYLNESSKTLDVTFRTTLDSEDEIREDRINLLVELSKLKNPPKSIPINLLVPIKGTPLENVTKLDGIEFIRMIATTRIIFYKSVIRLSAGRDGMSEEMQALCFFAGANSIFYGEKLLTTNNSSANRDLDFLNKLGLNAQNY